MKKILSSVLCMVLVLSFGSCFAFDFGDNTPTPTAPGDNASTLATNIIGFIQWIGYAIAVGMLVYVGIKYVMSSAAEKADLKQNLIRYVIGAVIIASATAIASFIFNATYA